MNGIQKHFDEDIQFKISSFIKENLDYDKYIHIATIEECDALLKTEIDYLKDNKEIVKFIDEKFPILIKNEDYELCVILKEIKNKILDIK